MSDKQLMFKFAANVYDTVQAVGEIGDALQKNRVKQDQLNDATKAFKKELAELKAGKYTAAYAAFAEKIKEATANQKKLTLEQGKVNKAIGEAKNQIATKIKLLKEMKQSQDILTGEGKKDYDALKISIAKSKLELESYNREQARLKGEISAVTGEIKKYRTEQNKAASDTSRNIKENRKQYDKLIGSISDTKNQLTQTAREQTELNKSFKRLKLPEGSMASFRAETYKLAETLERFVLGVDGTENELKQLKKQLAANRSEIIKYDQSLNDGRTNVGRYSQSLTRLNTGFSQIGQAIGISTGVYAATSAIGFAVDSLKEFKFQMSGARALLQTASEAEIQSLDALAQKLGKDTVFTAGQSAEAIQFLAMAGFEANQIIAALPSTLNLAAAANMELGQAADIASNILSGFRLSAEQTARVVDVMAYTTATFNTNGVEMGEAMKFIAPAAAALKIPLEEVSVFVGAMGNNALKSGDATRALTSSLGRVANPTKKAKKSLKELNLSLFDSNGEFIGLTKTVSELEKRYKTLTPQQQLAHTAAIFGAEASKNITAALGFQKETMIDGEKVTLKGAEALEYFTGEAYKAEGAAKAMADIKLDNLSGDIARLKSAAQGAAISLGEMGEGGLRSFIQDITSLVPAIQLVLANVLALVGGGLSIFIKIIKATPQFLRDNQTALGLLGIAMVSLNYNAIVAQVSVLRLAASQKIAELANKRQAISQWLLNAAMTANPIGLVIAAIALLAAGFVTIYKHSETFRNGVNSLSNKFMDLYDNSIGLKLAFGAIIEPIRVIITLFRGAIASGDAFKAGIQSIITNVKERFISLGLSALKLGKQIQLGFTINPRKRTKIKEDLEKIEKEFDNSRERIKKAEETYQKEIDKANEKAKIGEPKEGKGGGVVDGKGSSAGDDDDNNNSNGGGGKDEAKRKLEEKKKNILEADKQIEDLKIQLIKKADDRSIAQLKLKAQRDIEAIKVTGEQKVKIESLINSKLSDDIQKIKDDAAAKSKADQLKKEEQDAADKEQLRKNLIEATQKDYEEEKALLIERLANNLISEEEYNNLLLEKEIEFLEQKLMLQDKNSQEEFSIRQTLAAAKLKQEKELLKQELNAIDEKYEIELENEENKLLAQSDAIREKYLNDEISYEEYLSRLKDLEEEFEAEELRKKIEAEKEKLGKTEEGTEEHRKVQETLSNLNTDYHLLEIDRHKKFEEEKTRISEEQQKHRLEISKRGLDFLTTISDIALEIDLKNAGENEEQQKKAQRRAAIRGKALASAQAAINTFEAATKALASAPPPFGQILAAISVAQGLANIALINAKPLPKLAHGGIRIDRGVISRGVEKSGGYYPSFKKHSEGGSLVEMAQGEMAVTPMANTRKGRSIVSHINSIHGGIQYPDTIPIPSALDANIRSWLSGADVSNVSNYNMPKSMRPATFNAPSISSLQVSSVPKMALGGTSSMAGNNALAKQMQMQNALLQEQNDLIRSQKTVSLDVFDKAGRREAKFDKFGEP